MPGFLSLKQQQKAVDAVKHRKAKAAFNRFWKAIAKMEVE